MLLPAGTYLSGSLFFKSHVDFHLAQGAVLKGSPDREDYNAADVYPQNWASGGAPYGDNISGGHLILAVGVTDVEMLDPPYWTCFLLNCERVQIRGCYVHNLTTPYRCLNGDGFDIDRCRHVTLSDCIGARLGASEDAV